MQVELWWAEAASDPTAGRRLLDRAASAVIGGLDVVVGRDCPGCGSTDHGRPVVADHPDLGLSLSRTAGHVVVAAVVGARVGVDVEALDTDVAWLADVALGPHDAEAPTAAALLRTWTRKEAVLKAAGVGLAVEPADVAVTAAHEAPAVTAWTTSAVPDPRPVRLLDLDASHGVPLGLVAAAAVTGAPTGAVVVRTHR